MPEPAARTGRTRFGRLPAPDEIAMRLTCPNCGADYDIPEGMVPAAGRHVQCSTCHTRWFVRGTARAPASEEQILTRLENWRPRPVQLVPPSAADRARRREPPPPAAASGRAAARRPAAVPPSRPTPRRAAAAPEPQPRAAPSAGRRRSPPCAARATDQARGAPDRRAPGVGLRRPAPAGAAPRPRRRPRRARARVAPSRSPSRAASSSAASSSFWCWRSSPSPPIASTAEIAATVPAAGPALDAYAATIDGWRADLEAVIGPYRPDAG